MKTLLAPTQTAVVVARLLERLDASREPVDAHQYRAVADRMADLLRDADIDWTPLLEQSPAAATIYENLHYASAGLCRSPLEQATAAELATRDWIAALQRKSAAGAPPPPTSPSPGGEPA